MFFYIYNFIKKCINIFIINMLDPMVKNSLFLVISSLASAGSGFIFWLIVAKFYTNNDVGIASAIISIMGLIVLLSSLGFDIALTKYLPEKNYFNDNNKLISTCLSMSIVTSFLCSIIAVLVIYFFMQPLSEVFNEKIVVIVFVFFSTLLPTYELQKHGVFVGLKKTEYSLLLAIIVLTRITLIPLLKNWEAIGVYVAYAITPIIASVIGIHLLKIKFGFKYKFTIDKNVVCNIFKFSLGNYLARIFEMLPNFVLPIIVINILGGKENAYFFIAWQISFILIQIPRFTCLSMLSSVISDKNKFFEQAKKSVQFIYSMLLFAILFIVFFGEYILFMLGKEYAQHSYPLLLILMFASLPFGLNSLYCTINRIEENIMPVIFTYGGISFIAIFIGYYLTSLYGTVGMCYSWIIANVGTLIVIIFINRKNVLFTKNETN